MSEIGKVFYMIQRSWVQTPVRSNFKCVVHVSQISTNNLLLRKQLCPGLLVFVYHLLSKLGHSHVLMKFCAEKNAMGFLFTGVHLMHRSKVGSTVAGCIGAHLARGKVKSVEHVLSMCGQCWLQQNTWHEIYSRVLTISRVLAFFFFFFFI